MEDNPLTLEEQEQFAIKNYRAEESKIPNKICKQTNKKILSNNMINGLISGLAIGILYGAFAGDAKSRQPVYDYNGTVINYTFDADVLAKFTLKSLSIAVAVALILAAIKTKIDQENDRLNIERTAYDLFEEYLYTSLNKFDPFKEKLPHVSYPSYVRAMALIVNNMPESELNRIQAFIESEIMEKNTNDQSPNKASPYGHTINAVAQIISNRINYDPELKKNVLAILNGGKPTTYFLKQNQKVR